MTLTATEIGEIVDGFANDARREWDRLATLQKRIEGKLLRTWMPENADGEYRDLFRKASSPWLTYVRDTIAQGCRLKGFTSATVWERAWQANNMDGRQGSMIREAIGLGKTFGMAIPDENKTGVVMRPLSALTTYAVFATPWDDYPEYVLHRYRRGKSNWDGDWFFFDAEAFYQFTGDPRTPRNVRVTAHDLGFTPVVQIVNATAVDGTPQSSVEPAIPVYQRIVDATFTLQMVQRYGAFPQKWMAGGELAVDENGRSLVRSSVDGLIHASGESGESARFGTFQPADLDKVVAALDAHIKHLAAVCQVPPHYLLGAVINMSAEGIAAAESGYYRNIADRKEALGEGFELWLRTAAAIIGDPAQEDISAQVEWHEVVAYQLSQIGDFISKVEPLGASVDKLLSLVPGWTDKDVTEALDGRPSQRSIEMRQVTA